MKQPHKPAAEGGGNRYRSVVQLLGAAAAFALLVLGVMVIRIATDRGELIVRSHDPNARLLIKRADGKAVKELTIENGRGKMTIRSGDYVVELLSNADRMMIDKNEFKVMRGGEVVLTVQQRPTQPSAESEMGYGMGMPEGDRVEGEVTAVGEKNLVEISLGADDGIRVGHKLDVYREGAYLGKVVVVRTSQDRAVAEIILDYLKGTIREGDRVADLTRKTKSFSSGADDAGDSDMGMGMDSSDYGSEYGGEGGSGYSSTREGLKDRLVYDSKSYNQWMRILATERNPDQLVDAVKAITVLAPEAGGEDAAAALLRIMRAYPTRSRGMGQEMPGGKLGNQILVSLFSMEPNAVAKSIQQEISLGNANSRQFISLLVSSYFRADADPTTARLMTALKQLAPEVVAELLKLSEVKDQNVSRWAVNLAADLTEGLKLDMDQFPQLGSLLTKELDSKNQETVANVAGALSHVAPETEGLAEVLLQLADQPSYRQFALEAIGRLGPRAKIALPKLIEVLDEVATYSNDEFGYGGMMGEEDDYGGEDMYSEMSGNGMEAEMGGSYGMMGGFDDTAVNVQSALRAIEQMRPEDAAAAMPLLRKLAEQMNPYRAAARRVLKKLETPADPK
jgi:hypothetical protein